MADVGSNANLPRDISRLLSWKVQEATQYFSRRDTALYALSVGLGHDPFDKDQLRFVDPWHTDFSALPTMALALGYPGFWLGQSDVEAATGVRGVDVLHVEQSIELHELVPVEGKVIGRTTVTGLVDKGASRGCLLHSERHIHEQETHRLLAVCRQTHYLRGHGGFGNADNSAVERSAAPLASQGEVLQSVALSTRPEQALIYRLNGDANPIHFDSAAALHAGHARPILHGMATMGVVGHAVLRMLLRYDASRMGSISFRMTAPVFPGETLVTVVAGDGSFKTCVQEREGIIAGAGVVRLHESRGRA